MVVGGDNLVTSAKLISNVTSMTDEGVIDPGVADQFWDEICNGMPSNSIGKTLTRLTDQVS